MKNILKYIRPYIILILLVLVLVFIQAEVDLALPDYMANIIKKT